MIRALMLSALLLSGPVLAVEASEKTQEPAASSLNQVRVYRDKDGNMILTNASRGDKPRGEQFSGYEYDPVATREMHERAQYDRKHPQYTPVYRWVCVGTDARCVMQRVRVR